MDVKAYAESVGRAHSSVHHEVTAARVADIAGYMDAKNVEHLVAIHTAPEWLWSALEEPRG